MSLTLLEDLVIVFGLSVVVVLLFSRARLPPVVGFLLTGVLVGPHALGLVRERHEVEVLAELGIVVLLFSVGVEISLAEMLRLRRVTVLGGGLQVLLTGAAGTAVATLAGLPLPAAVAVGLVLAPSSTAIALRLLAQRAETTSPHGRIALGMLVFQDLAVVPMLLAIPLLAGGAGGTWAVVETAGRAALVVVAVVFVLRHLVTRVLAVVVRARSRELFLLCVVILCLGTAWLTAKAGLSLALGAFLAGLVISESEYSHQALGAVMPFRDAFNSLFFVSVGMLLDVGAVAARPWATAAATVAVLLGKAALVTAVAALLGFPLRIALLSGLLLAQIGEFSLLVLEAGADAGLLTPATRQLLLAATVLTMALTPLLALAAPRAVERLPLSGGRPAGDPSGLSDHVIIVGHGVNGQNVARALKQAGMPYVILEINPETVARLRRADEPVLWGDAIYPEVLGHAGATRARVMVVTIPDAAAARQVVMTARELNPALHLVARTRFVSEVADLYRLGANEVVPEEFETSIEIFSRVLRTYLVPREVIDRAAREARKEGYDMLRAASDGYRPVEGLRRLLGDVELEAYGVAPGSELEGRTLAEARLSQATGALVLAIHRDHKTTANPGADWRLHADDVALVLGSPEALAATAKLFLPRQ